MSNSERIGGVDTYVFYKLQSDYTTANTGTMSVFGGLVTNAKFDVDRQYNERPGFVGTGAGDGRATAKILPGTVVTNATVDFDVQRWDWLEAVLLADRTGSGTTAQPYVYTVGNTNKFLTLTDEIDNVTTDSQKVFGGMVIDSASIKCDVGEPVTASLTFKGGRLSKNATINVKQAQLTDEVYNFSGGSIENPSGTKIDNIIDSVSIDINNNYTVIYGFNEEAQNARPGKLGITAKFTLKYLDDTQMEQLMGSSNSISDQTEVDVTVKFEKDTDKYVELEFKGLVYSKIDEGHSLNEFVTEDIDTISKLLEITEVME